MSRGKLVVAIMCVGAMSGIAAASPNVRITSAIDDTTQGIDQPARARHARVVRQALATSLDAAPALSRRQIDISVISLTVDPDLDADVAEVGITAKVRIAISDDSGTLRAVLAGGATLTVPARSFHADRLPRFREEALVAAVDGMFDKVVVHLRADPANGVPPTARVAAVTTAAVAAARITRSMVPVVAHRDWLCVAAR